METTKIESIKKIIKNNSSVLAVYLFGSQARGKSNKYSDIDIAVLFDNKIRREEYTDRQIALMNFLSKSLKRETDVVVLNRAPLFLRYLILKEGKKIYERPGRDEHRFEAMAIVQYFDFLPVKTRIENALLSKIREA